MYSFVVLAVFAVLPLICTAQGIPLIGGENYTAISPGGEIQAVANRFLNWDFDFDLKAANQTDKPSLILAASRTYRKNPLDNLNYYNRGWNITSKDYYGSVLYTAAPLFMVAVVWLGVFGLCLLLACICFCCCGRREYGYSRRAYALSLIALALFTLAAVVGSAVLYTGQGKFHATTSDTLDYVVSQSDSTAENLRNVSEYLEAAKNTQVAQIALPIEIQNRIDQVDRSVITAADTLHDETIQNKHRIQDILHYVSTLLIVVSIVMLVLALLGFLLSLLGMQCLVSTLVIVGWVFVAITFILAGVFLALYNVTGDTCVALDEWVQNPTAHTALDDILPCVDRATTQQALNQSKYVTYQLVEVVNRIIRNVSNQNLPPNVAPLFYNQSGPLVPLLCNPLNADVSNRTCSPDEVDFINSTEVWKGYVCQVSDSNMCTTVGRLTPLMYDQMSSSVNVSYGLNHYGPFLSDLLDCTFVRDTFRTIHNEHCPDLNSFSKLIYIGLIMVASAVALSLILWVLYARERRHRKFTRMIDARTAHDPFGPKGQH